MLKSTHLFIEKVAKKIDYPKDKLGQLLDFNNVIEFKVGEYKAYRVQHNNTLGPYKGGVRFHQDVSLDEVKSLATLMSLKAAAVGLPLGGGKGGVAVNPKKLSEKELEELSRGYVNGIYKQIGPKVDIPAPDVNTNPMIIDWMVDEYSKKTGDSTKASFTGKSIDNNGSKGRNIATGRGGALALKVLLENDGAADDSLTYAVQGFGNAGTHFAQAAEELLPGLSLVAASDSSGGVSSGFGLDTKDLISYKEKGGKLKEFENAGVAQIDNQQLISEEVDILVLAALGGSITEKNASYVKAKYIVELANGPVTDGATSILDSNGVKILPDILANAGGVIVSYFEWQQNLSGKYLSLDQVNKKLAKYMQEATKAVLKLAKKKSLNLREAAIARALSVILKG